MADPGDLILRPAEAGDAEQVLDFIRELAQAEAFPFPLTVTAEDLRANLFGARPAAEVLLGFIGGEPACFAVFYETFSTATGKRGLHLDDLLVRPAFQGRGYGNLLMRRLAALADARGYARFEWWVLRTNARAIRFYQGIGACPLEELVVFRAQGEALKRMAR
jgi:ribosomal protein S18 acetylase RimI-like enzyme